MENETVTVRVDSPCVEVCDLDYVNKVCRGCRRTLDEIQAWAYCNEDERLRILQNIRERKQYDQIRNH